MQVENESMETHFLPLRTLMDVDSSATTCENEAESPSVTRRQRPVEVL